MQPYMSLSLSSFVVIGKGRERCGQVPSGVGLGKQDSRPICLSTHQATGHIQTEETPPVTSTRYPPARSLCVATASVHRFSSVLHWGARHSHHVEEVIISGSSFQFRFHFESTFNICSVVCFKQWEVLLSDRVVLLQVRTQLCSNTQEKALKFPLSSITTLYIMSPPFSAVLSQ